MKLKWRIYYGDGSCFDSSMGKPEDAPPVNVQVILQPHKENGRQTIHLWDWYYWYKDYWYGADIWGLLDQLLWNRVTAVKQGRMTTNEQYEEIMKKAISDPDFNHQTAEILRPKPKQVYGEGFEYEE